MAEKTQVQAEHGIDTLIARLRDDGIAAGRSTAEKLVADAQSKARAIVDKADADANAKIAAAQKESDSLRRAGEEALRTAARDTVLSLKDELSRRFADDVAKTVSNAMKDEELLRQMILAVVGRVREQSEVDKAKEVEVVLPRTAVGLDELRKKPEELREGSLVHFVAASAREMLREGLTFGRADDEESGIRLQLLDRGVSIDLTDRAVAEAILVHLQPRFRALLEGVVK